MAKNIRVAWTTKTSDAVFPPGMVVDHIHIILFQGDVQVSSQDVPPGTADALFPDIAPGTYKATIQGFDGSNSPLGDPLTTNEGIVPADNIALELPDTVTLTVE